MANIKFNDKPRATPSLIDGIPYQVGTANTGDVKTVNPSTLKSVMMTDQDLDIGTGTFDCAKIQLDPTIAIPSYSKGLVFYDKNKRALSYYTEEPDVTLNICKETVVDVKNTTGSTIPNGSVVTSLSSDGAVHTIQLADAHYKNKSRFIGVATNDISNGAIGLATIFGDVGGLNTSSYSAGQALWLSAITPGAFSTIPPDDGGYEVIIGVVKVSHATEGIITVYPNVSNLTVEVTDTNGFPPDQRTGTTLTAVEGTRTLTIAPTGSEFHFYEQGDKYEKSASENIAWTDVEGIHWFYYDAGVLIHLVNPSSATKIHIILNHAFICAIYWNATNNKIVGDIQDERHGISMSPETHLYLHSTRGAQWISGYGLGDFVIGNGNTNAHAQFSVATGSYFDEDISHTESGIAVGGTIPVLYNLGASMELRADTQAGYSVLNAASGRLYYNENNGGTWQLTEVTEGDFVLYHIFGFNGVTVHTIAVMGQGIYDKKNKAKEAAATEISNIVGQFEIAELVPLGTIIYQTKSTYTNATKSRVIEPEGGVNYVDWRTTELAQGSTPSAHNNLTNVEMVGTGITQGHIDNSQPAQFPELTTTERDAVTAPNGGVVIFNTTTNKLNFYNGSAWEIITSSV